MGIDERHAYRTHRIDLVLLETTRGRYRWIAFVDGEHMSVGPEALSSLVVAREEALRLAHTMIDTLEATRPPATSPWFREPTGVPGPTQPVDASTNAA